MPTSSFAATVVVDDGRRRRDARASSVSDRVGGVVRNAAHLPQSRAARNDDDDDDEIRVSPSGAEETATISLGQGPSVRRRSSSSSDHTLSYVESETGLLMSADDGDSRANETRLVAEVARPGEYVANYPDSPYVVPFSYSLYAKKLLKIAHILHYGSIAILGVFVVQVNYYDNSLSPLYLFTYLLLCDLASTRSNSTLITPTGQLGLLAVLAFLALLKY